MILAMQMASGDFKAPASVAADATGVYFVDSNQSNEPPPWVRK
jgi:hypothetical protein